MRENPFFNLFPCPSSAVVATSLFLRRSLFLPPCYASLHPRFSMYFVSFCFSLPPYPRSPSSRRRYALVRSSFFILALCASFTAFREAPPLPRHVFHAILLNPQLVCVFDYFCDSQLRQFIISYKLLNAVRS